MKTGCVFLLLCATAFAQTPAPAEDKRDRILYSDETEHFKPLVSKLARNIVLDQEEIWTSPFHMNRKNAKWWILFGGATAALIAVDHKIANNLPNTADQVSFGNKISTAGAEYTVLPMVAGLYAFGALADNAKARETSMLGGEAALDALIVGEALKYATRRPRPLRPEAGQFFENGDSFPSGHSLAVWSAASVFAAEYNKTIVVPIAAYSLASVVSLSRIAARKHFASDVLFGSATGWFIGRYVVRTHNDHAIHKHRIGDAVIHPRVGPAVAPGGYGIAMSWGQAPR